MNFQFNKKAAIVFYIVMASVSILFWGGNSLNKLYVTGSAYFNDLGHDFQPVSQVILDAAGQAANMTVLMSRAGYSQGDFDEFSNTIELVNAEQDVYKKFKHYERMIEMAENYYNQIDMFNFSDTDRQRMTEIMGNMTASVRIIEYSYYYQQAEAINEDLSRFPASFIRTVRGINLLPTFYN